MSFQSKITTQRLLWLAVCASIVTIMLGATVADKARVAVQWALAPFGDGGMYVTNWVRQAGRKPRVLSQQEIEHWEQERRALLNVIAHLQDRMDTMSAEAPQMRHIYGQLQRGKFPFELIPGRIVAHDSMPYGRTAAVTYSAPRTGLAGARVTTRTLLTDLSKSLPKNMPALALPADVPSVAGCVLVGRLVEASPLVATLQLVTDRDFKARVKIQRIDKDPRKPRMVTVIEPGGARTEPLKTNRLVSAFAEGDGEGLVIKGVSRYDNVMVGDLVGSQEDTFLPVSLVIGEVVEVKDDHSGRVALRVRPAADLETLRYVYIVVTGR